MHTQCTELLVWVYERATHYNVGVTNNEATHTYSIITIQWTTVQDFLGTRTASLCRVPLHLIKDLPTLEQKVIQCLLSSRIVGSSLICRTRHLYLKHLVCHCG